MVRIAQGVGVQHTTATVHTVLVVEARHTIVMAVTVHEVVIC